MLLNLYFVFGLIWCVQSLDNCNPFIENCATLVPVDPNLAIDEAYTFNCSLNTTLMRKYGVESQHIKFEIVDQGNGNFTDTTNWTTTIVDSQSATYSTDAVKLSHSAYWIKCDVLHDGALHRLTHQHVHVGYQPFVPTLQDFSVFNWTQVIIRFSVTKRNPYFTTFYHVQYQISDNKEWQNCGDKQQIAKGSHVFNCTSEINLSDVLNSTFARVRVKISNPVANYTTSTTDSFMLLQNVVPPKVHKVHIDIKKRSVSLSWDSFQPNKFIKNMTYEITCNEKIYETSSHWLEIPDLRPFSNYTISIRNRAYYGRKWSEKYELRARTLQDVPDKPPMVTAGSYFIKLHHSKDSTRWRNIILFWKEIPEHFRNGIITHYKIITIDASGSMVPSVEKVQDNTHNEMVSFEVKNLKLEDEYKFYVDACTEEGYNSTFNLSALAVPKQSLIRHLTKVKFVANDNDLKVIWKPIKANITIFWCKGNSLNNVRCMDGINWHIVDGTIGKTSIPILHPGGVDGRMFGSSVTIGKLSSGIKWTSCIYSSTEVPHPPEYEKELTEHELILKLHNPECSQSKSDVISYRVYYCIVQTDTSQVCEKGLEMQKLYRVGSADRFIIGNLEAAKKYRVKLQSIAHSKESHNITFIVETQNERFFNKTSTKSILGVVGAIVLVFIVFGMVTCIKCQINRIKKHRRKIPISPPDFQVVYNPEEEEMLSKEKYAAISNGSLNGSDQTDIDSPHTSIGVKIEPNVKSFVEIIERSDEILKPAREVRGKCSEEKALIGEEDSALLQVVINSGNTVQMPASHPSPEPSLGPHSHSQPVLIINPDTFNSAASSDSSKGSEYTQANHKVVVEPFDNDEDHYSPTKTTHNNSSQPRNDNNALLNVLEESSLVIPPVDALDCSSEPVENANNTSLLKKATEMNDSYDDSLENIPSENEDGENITVYSQVGLDIQGHSATDGAV